MRVGYVFEFIRIEGRCAEVAFHLMAGVVHDNISVRMAHLHSQRIEMGELVRTEEFGRRDLKQDRLRRDSHSRHRDLIALAKILERPDARIAADEPQRQGAGGGNALDPAARPVPKQQQLPRSGIDDIDPAGNQRILLRAAIGEGNPFDGCAAKPAFSACFSISLYFSMICSGI